MYSYFRDTTLASGLRRSTPVSLPKEDLRGDRVCRIGDFVLPDPQTRKTLGIECKFQAVAGTAEEKIPSVINDIAAWPIPGLVVFAGEGFTHNMQLFLISTGKAVEFSELKPWRCLFFGLPFD